MSWSKKALEWIDGNKAYISVAFTWDLPKAKERASTLVTEGYTVYAGGPACLLMPEYLSDVAHVNALEVSALERHNPEATFTSRGCVRNCKFCAVPKIEGKLVELDNWPVRPIVCDNNLLACSKAHFDKVVDRLKPLKKIDFNQGLDARLLTKYHADRLAELDCMTRLAFDSVNYESQFMRAYEALRKAKIAKRRIRVYVLIGFDDTPEDALYRLELVRSLKITPNPMRYQPLDILKKNSYVSPDWTDKELKRYMRYWSRLRWLNSVPFEEYDGDQSKNAAWRKR